MQRRQMSVRRENGERVVNDIRQGDIWEVLRPEILLEATHGMDPKVYAERVQRYMTQYADRAAKVRYNELLRIQVQDARSVLVSVMKDRQVGLSNSDHFDMPLDPKEVRKIGLRPKLIKIHCAPMRPEIMKGLVGVLTAHELEFETPRYQEILQGIVRGQIIEYNGNACKEFYAKDISL